MPSARLVPLPALICCFLGAPAPVLGLPSVKPRLVLCPTEPIPSKTCASWTSLEEPCLDYPITAPRATPTFVYIVATTQDSAGLGAISFGIGYDETPSVGIDVIGWTSCADAELPGSGSHGPWPAARSGNRVFWAGCGKDFETADPADGGVHVVVGALSVYAYSEDMLVLLEHEPMAGVKELNYVDCNSVTQPFEKENVGCLWFDPTRGFGFGYNPCTEAHQHYDPGPWIHALMFHVEASGEPTCAPVLPDYQNLVTSGPTTNPDGSAEYVVYLLGGDAWSRGGARIAGVRMGIDYTSHAGPGEGLVIHDWATCGLETPTSTWPEPGSGNSIIWDPDVYDCQVEPLVVVGWFRVSAYGPSTLTVAPHPESGKITVADCQGYGYLGICETFRPVDFDANFIYSPPRTGWASFGGGAFGSDDDGCNPMLGPCVPAPVQSSTWGSLKHRFLDRSTARRP